VTLSSDVLEAKLCTEARLYLGVLLIRPCYQLALSVKLGDIVWELLFERNPDSASHQIHFVLGRSQLKSW
jgi:hypothetical protein